MLRLICKGKIHLGTVTTAKLDYEGSIAIDSSLMERINLLPFEMVQVTNLSNAVRWETYAIPAPAGSCEISLNGPPARLFQPGDRVIILSMAYVDEAELPTIQPKVLILDEQNRILD